MKPNREHAQKERDIFASNFRRILAMRGKTQSDVVSDLEIRSSTVSDWANAKKYPRVDKMQALADYLGVVISDLREEPDLTHTGKQETSPSTAEAAPGEEIRQEIIRLLEKLSEEQRDLVLTLLRLTAARNQGLPAADLVSAGEAALKSELQNPTR